MSAKRLPGSPLTLYVSVARTASPTAHEPYRLRGVYRGLAIQIDATASAATPSVVFTLQSQTGPDADWATQIESAAVTGVSTTNIIAHPGAVDIANLSESTQIGQKWRVIATHADADSITYSVRVWPLV